MAKSNLDDRILRQTVLNEGYKNGAAQRIWKLVKNAIEDVEKRVTNTDFQRMRKGQQQKFFDSLRKKLASAKITDAAFAEAVALAKVEAEAMGRAITLSAKDAGLEYEALLPTASAVQAAATAKVLTVRGPDRKLLLKPYLRRGFRQHAALLLREIRTGYVTGKSNQEIARSIRRKTALSRNAVMAVTRTGVASVANTARQVVAEKNADVIKGIRWMAFLDSRTSPQCRSLDRREFPLKRGPRPPLHINCRSTFVYITKGKLKDIDDQGSRASRLKRGGEITRVSGNLDYYDWLKQQTKGFQNTVLGPGKGDLFRSKGMTPDKFAKLELNKQFMPRTLKEMQELAEN